MFRKPRCPRLASAVAVATLLLCAGATQAREPLYGALTDPALLKCEDQHWHGHTNEAGNCYRDLSVNAKAPGIRAEALWALGDLQGANAAFRQAVDAEPKNAMLRVRWGELFTQTYQYDEADKLFDEALVIDDKNAWAKIGSALALANGGGEGKVVDKLMHEVIDNELAPKGARYRGFLTAIHSALSKDRFDEAADAIKEARSVAEAGKLPQLELYALEASRQFMLLQPYQNYIDQALKEDPAYGDAWAIPGHYAMITRRYRESGTFYEKAVAIEPT
ncbi:MAG TPA: hypothetical protein VMH83_08840, partial [Candidatus Acidoferrum sp.]|nr:hypothetical protein [Candidatus Acidoferrum sp.]